MPSSPAQVASSARLWLALSLGSTFVCATGCFGLLGALWSVVALHAAERGDLALAEQQLRSAKVSVVVGIVVLVVAVGSYGVARFVLKIA